MLLPFPREKQMAESFFREATRHLQDARILHRSQRHPASITSSMKAAELGLKSALLLSGASGWLEAALQTHCVFAEINKQTFLTQTFLDALQNYDTSLPSDIKLMEELVPFKPDIKKLEISQAGNTEYPFFAFVPGTSPSTDAKLYLPETYFTSADSEKHFGTAHRLLSALQALAPEIKAWKMRLCQTL